MRKVKLLPCPFCGGEPMFLQLLDEQPRRALCEVICKCGARMAKGTSQTTIRAWNRRANNGNV